MGTTLSEAQTNIENKAIGKHNGKLTCMLLTICDGKYVLYFLRSLLHHLDKVT